MVNRLHSICPYFAMFPPAFVESFVNEFTDEYDCVYDPFAGRGTTVFQSLLMGRRSIGSDINPVAFCISAAKAEIPSLEGVNEAIDRMETDFKQCNHNQLDEVMTELPSFFRRAFYPSTLRQLLFLRENLRWRTNQVERFIAALALGSLHGEMDRSSSYFSNQMPRTISPKPGYALRYWRIRHLWPKKRDVFELLRQRAVFRLVGELPTMRGTVALLDVRKAGEGFPSLSGKVKAVITSPPYFNMTRAEEDQWLRLWFLGNAPHPTYNRISRDDRHSSKSAYWKFISEAWAGIAPLLQPGAILVCRLGAKGMTEDELTTGLVNSIKSTFQDGYLVRPPVRTDIQKRQTDSFRPGSPGCVFEVDYAFILPQADR